MIKPGFQIHYFRPVQSPEEIRARYPSGEYKANELAVPADQLKVRSMNFGQFWRGEGADNLSYAVSLPLQFAIDIIAWQLPDYVEDSKEFPDESSLMERLLKEEDWNTDADYLLHKGPELLRQLLLEEYAHEMLLQWFGDGVLKIDGFVLNTIEKVELKNGLVLISGLCRSTGTSSAYQDF